jgi:hypothetical protein
MKGGNTPKEFQIYPWSKEIEEGVKIPWEGKNGGEIRDTGSWGDETTNELKNPMEERQNHHQGVLEPLHGLFFWMDKSEEWRGKFYPG